MLILFRKKKRNVFLVGMDNLHNDTNVVVKFKVLQKAENEICQNKKSESRHNEAICISNED